MQQILVNCGKARRDGGFHEDSLAALVNVFGKVTRTAPIAPMQAVAWLLKPAPDFEQVAAFDRRVVEAEVRPRRQRPRHVSAEMNVKVGKMAIDWAECLARRRTTGKVTGGWKVAAERLGLTLEKLANGLATAPGGSASSEPPAR